ncbi:MAG TPA: ParB/RepB/Spo0J family partition protein [Thermoanaerobaculia bacterium]|nr:ParB/RepB/Spo0J family partition protein [Thermoanaerobaculia bacterium]
MTTPPKAAPTKRHGLGRGLDALLPPAGADVRTLPVDRLRPNRFQPRRDFEPEALAELAASIRSQGVVQPIVVKPEAGGVYTIVAGERRWRAAQQAGLEQVPVVVHEVRDDRHLLELALVENLQRSDLNPIEEALAFQSLQNELGLSQDDIASRVGKSRPTISNSLRLLNLPAQVQEMMRTGRLTAGQAKPLLALGKAAQQVALAERAVAEGLSARQLEALAAAARKGETPREAVAAAPDVHSAAAAERLTRHLQTKVEIHRRRAGGGLLQIHFFSEEDLMRLYDRLIAAEDAS